MKKHNIIAIISLLVIMISPIQAQQNTFTRVFQLNPTNELCVQSVVPAFDNNYLLVGNALDLVNKGLIMNTDSVGNMLWNRVFSNNSSTNYPNFTFNCIIKTVDSCFLITGSAYDTIDKCLNALYMKIDTEGDTIWSKTIHITNSHSKILSVQQTFDSGYVVTGRADLASTGYMRTLVARIDKDGNLLWSNLLSISTQGSIGYSVKQAPDTSFLIAGLNINYSPQVIEAFLLKLFPDGNLIWAKKYNFLYQSDCLCKDFVITDSGIFMYLNIYGYTAFIQTDFSGNVLWSKSYIQYVGGPGFLDDLTHRIHISSDSMYYFVQGNHSWGSISKFDLTGNLIWSKNLDLAPIDVIETKNKEFLIVGNDHNISFNIQIGVIQTDSLGNNQNCVSPTDNWLIYDSTQCYPVSFNSISDGIEKTIHPVIDTVIIEYYNGCVTTGYEMQENGLDYKVFIYPNPAISYLVVDVNQADFDFAYFELFDCYGRKLKEVKLKRPTQTVSLDGVMDGMYLYRIRNKNLVVDKGKILVIK